jgi:hypothetical protein
MTLVVCARGDLVRAPADPLTEACTCAGCGERWAPREVQEAPRRRSADGVLGCIVLPPRAKREARS